MSVVQLICENCNINNCTKETCPQYKEVHKDYVKHFEVEEK